MTWSVAILSQEPSADVKVVSKAILPPSFCSLPCSGNLGRRKAQSRNDNKVGGGGEDGGNHRVLLTLRWSVGQFTEKDDVQEGRIQALKAAAEKQDVREAAEGEGGGGRIACPTCWLG
eukprot:763289-Hanusia_phi.AAC.3